MDGDVLEDDLAVVGEETLHVVSLPHTETTSRYLHCAYTQKVVKFCKMMTRLGRRVVLYAGEENEAECVEHVSLVSKEEREKWFGPWDENGLFGNVDWSPGHHVWKAFNARAIDAIQARKNARDFLCLTAGWSQSPIAYALKDCLPVEWAVGYEGIHLEHRVFESYAWMHHVYGLKQMKDGRAFDTVIPNFFDPEDFFPVATSGESRSPFLLFVGRVIRRKGPHVAAEIAKRCGKRLIIAGPGVVSATPGRVVASDVTIEGDHVEYCGPVDKDERATLMRNADAVLVPTQYIEPFGGVAVEAMMAGTPVVATDWGAFTETVVPGVSGERFRTLAEGAEAVEKVRDLSRERVREYALARYSLDAVGPRFEEHFQRLSTLWDGGWYA